MTILNGRIENTMLGNEDHGIFTFMIDIKFEGTGCGFGGYALDEYDKTKKERVGTNIGTGAIMKLLKTLDLNKWEDLKGCYVRCEMENQMIKRIGHVIKDKWFCPKEYFELEYHTEVIENLKKENKMLSEEINSLSKYNKELFYVLHSMVVEETNYMYINNLGDPFKQHNIQRAIEIMEKVSGMKDLKEYLEKTSRKK